MKQIFVNSRQHLTNQQIAWIIKPEIEIYDDLCSDLYTWR